MQFYDLSKLRVPGSERAAQAPSARMTIDLNFLGPGGEEKRRADKNTTMTVTRGTATLLVAGESSDIAEGVSVSIAAGSDYVVSAPPDGTGADVQFVAAEELQQFRSDVAHNEPQRLT